MNEGSGATVNDVTGTNHGTATDTSWVTGKYGKGLSFDGLFGLVTVDHNASLRLGSNMTLSAWVKPSSVDDWFAVMGKDYETLDDLSYALYASDGFTPLGWLTTQGQSKEVAKHQPAPGEHLEPPRRHLQRQQSPPLPQRQSNR
ncbi:hypothetical protein ACFSTC_37970 [Nonomuraea ferruginea]